MVRAPFVEMVAHFSFLYHDECFHFVDNKSTYTINSMICLRFTLPDAQIFSYTFIKIYNQAF